MFRRIYVLAAGLGISATAALFMLTKTPAQPAKTDPVKTNLIVAKAEQPVPDDQPSAKTQQLPIGQVVLFSSGVGYFQREGQVEGTTRVDLSFPVQDINDLLKSMVLRDLDGGHISTVSYDSNAPVERTLKSFAINLTGNPSFGAILNQARGEKVEVVLQQANSTQPGTMTGTVVGIEKQHVAVGKDTVEVEMLNLWCADGMRSLKMPELQRVRFLNPIMDSEFRKALETLSLSHDTGGRRGCRARARARRSSCSEGCEARAERLLQIHLDETALAPTRLRRRLSRSSSVGVCDVRPDLEVRLRSFSRA